MSTSYATPSRRGRSQAARIPLGSQNRWGTRTRVCFTGTTANGCRSSTRRPEVAWFLRQDEGNGPRKCLFHWEQHDSLHRHHSLYCQSDQILTEDTVRHFRLNPTESDCRKARRGHAASPLSTCRVPGPLVRQPEASASLGAVAAQAARHSPQVWPTEKEAVRHSLACTGSRAA